MSSFKRAERVIRVAGRERPADAVMRQELKPCADLSAEEAAGISEAVFAYYRWRGWLEAQEPLAWQIDQALSLTDWFAREPQAFSDANLM